MSASKTYHLLLDLKDDPALIAEYERHHQNVWPEVLKSIESAGILKMEIYRYGNRLVMMMETAPHFTFKAKAATDAGNEKVQQWEQLMWQYQQALPGAPEGAKWQLMDLIFSHPATPL